MKIRTAVQDFLNPSEKNDDDIMNIAKKIIDMESDEDTFTLQVTDDSGLEDNDSKSSSDSSSKKQKALSVRILSDTYYDDDDDDDDNNCYDTDTEKLVQSRQTEATDSVQSNYVERSSDRAVENTQKGRQDNCFENRNETIGGSSDLELSLRDFIEDQGHQIGSYDIEIENSGIRDIECASKHIEVDPKDNEDIDFTEKQWEFLPSAFNGVELDVRRIDSLEEQQVLEDFESLINQEKNQNSTHVENVNREFEVKRSEISLEEKQALENFELLINQINKQNFPQVESVNRDFEVTRSDVNLEEQRALEDFELLINQKTKQNSMQIENVNREPAVVEIDVDLEEQRALEDSESLINQKKSQNDKKVKNGNRELEEGEIKEIEIQMHHEPAREQREKFAELIEVPDEVNDRLFYNVSDDCSDVSTIDNSYYDDFECPIRNPSPPGDGEFSTFEDDDPWDYVQSSLSDDCIIVDEIERSPRCVQSYTTPHENFSEYSTRDQSDEEYTRRYNDRKNSSRKRKSSTSSNHDSIEEINAGNKNVDPNYDDFTGICSKEEVSELPDDVEIVSKKRKSHYGRDEDHPLFRDIDAEFCEKLMRVKKQGEIIVRPSSKGPDYLKITWKVTDDIYQHIKVKKKLRSRSSGRYRYWINNKDFRCLDEIINLYVTPMVYNALKLLNYKHFKKGINGVKATAEELLKAEKNKNPNFIPYIISAVKRSPGKFLISYLPRVTCYHEYIKVVPEGFRFRDQSFDVLNELFIYFKANSKEVKPCASKDETIGSTTSSRPATPRPMTPRTHDLTPSILEVIHDLPDEKLESVRLILDSLAQSTSNPPTAFNQNPAPTPFMYNGYHQPYPPVPFPTLPFLSFQPTFRPAEPILPPTNNMALPVPYPKNLDLPVPNYNQPSTSRITNLPLPPGT